MHSVVLAESALVPSMTCVMPKLTMRIERAKMIR